jgi:hypothetical protein
MKICLSAKGGDEKNRVDTWKELWGESRGLPHLAKNERDAPNFLYAAPETTACAPFFKERRMKCAEPTRLYRKSGMWGTP